MRYKAGKLSDGYWGVFWGQCYYSETETRDQAEAERLAVIMSIKWHQRQIDKIELAAVKSGILQDGDLADILA